MLFMLYPKLKECYIPIWQMDVGSLHHMEPFVLFREDLYIGPLVDWTTLKSIIDIRSTAMLDAQNGTINETRYVQRVFTARKNRRSC